ncbi:MAG TPA: hypothetical protein VMA95_07600 [Streptosporangiaceae bacterium]|nr:hypothetical protein [Streptosporangiaceae bacterium]
MTVADGTGEGTGVCVGRSWPPVPDVSSVELTASSSAFPVASGLCEGAASGLCVAAGDDDWFWPGESVLDGVAAGSVEVAGEVGVAVPVLGEVLGLGLPLGVVLGDALGLPLGVPPPDGEQLGVALPPPPVLPFWPPGPVVPPPDEE